MKYSYGVTATNCFEPSKIRVYYCDQRNGSKLPQLFIGTDPIKEVDSLKYLGIHVDTRVKFNVQINHLKGKLSQAVECRLG